MFVLSPLCTPNPYLPGTHTNTNTTDTSNAPVLFIWDVMFEREKLAPAPAA